MHNDLFSSVATTNFDFFAFNDFLSSHEETLTAGNFSFKENYTGDVVKKPQEYAHTYILEILQQLFLLFVFLFIVPVSFVDIEIVFICLRFATPLLSRAFSVKFGT